MAHQLPVVAARASCLPEIYGDAAAYFDPHDPRGLADTIDGLLRDPVRRGTLVSAGSSCVESYSWRTTASVTLQCYREAIEESKRSA